VAKRLYYHLDKGDAVSKWVCAVSLRHNAEVVYGVGMLGPGRGGMLWSCGDDGVALQRVSEQVQGKRRQLVNAGKDAVFEGRCGAGLEETAQYVALPEGLSKQAA
jgi:hypothetical protein